MQRLGKRQFVAVGIFQVEKAFAPGCISGRRRSETAGLQVRVELVHVVYVENEAAPAGAPFWFGLLVLALGIASLFVSIPRSETEGIKAGNVNIGVEVRHSERVSPVVSAVLILGGAGMMIARARGRGK
jgi:hypothetical protein